MVKDRWMNVDDADDDDVDDDVEGGEQTSTN